MINSMTGFGTGRAIGDGWTIDVTIRTLNHRYLSVRIRSLQDRPQLQMHVHEIVKKAFQRGEIGVWVDVTREHEQSEVQHFDRQIVEAYLRELRQIVKEFSLPDVPSLNDLIRIGAFQTPAHPDEELWPLIQTALEQAIDKARTARMAEGRCLAEAVEESVNRLNDLLAQVKARIPQVREGLSERLQERISSLSVEPSLDPARLETEIAFLVERADVEEEVTRIEAHLGRTTALLKKAQPVGRELDFLGQELLREVNTLGAKARNLAINRLVLDMKVEIERFKEQVQNVE